MEFYTEQTRREYESKSPPIITTERKQEKSSSNPKPSKSTPAPRHIKEPPSRPSPPPPQQQKKLNQIHEGPSLPKVNVDLVKEMDKDVQIMMEKLKSQQKQKQQVIGFVYERGGGLRSKKS